MEVILKEFVNNVRENIPGYVAVSVTEVMSGESLISDSAVNGFDPSEASAYNVELINGKITTMQRLGLTDKLLDIQFNLSSQIHTINISPDGEYFVYLALDSEKTTMAITRKLMTKYREILHKELN